MYSIPKIQFRTALHDIVAHSPSHTTIGKTKNNITQLEKVNELSCSVSIIVAVVNIVSQFSENFTPPHDENSR